MEDQKLHTETAEEKRLKKLLNAYILVAKDRLGRVPTVDELQEMLSDSSLTDAVHDTEQSIDNDSDQVASEDGRPASKEEGLNKGEDSSEKDEGEDEEEEDKEGEEAEEEEGDEEAVEEKEEEEGEDKHYDMNDNHEGDVGEKEKSHSEPQAKILDTKVYYGLKDKKPDPDTILYYETPDGRYYSVEDQEWIDKKPSIIDHLHSRPIEFREKDIISAMINGIVDDDDYAVLFDAGMINETLQKLWDLLKKVDAQYKLLEDLKEDGNSDDDTDYDYSLDTQEPKDELLEKLDEIVDALSPKPKE